jgi:hypothetical protein
MAKTKDFRGSGFRHNLQSVCSSSGIWVIVMVLTAPVLTMAMMWGEVVPESSHSDIWFFLLTRMPLIVLAALGLAIFTTNRVAGPMICLRRAFEEVKGGNLDYRIRFRRDDKHLLEVETAFNEMMVARNEGVGVGIEVEVAQDRRAVS